MIELLYKEKDFDYELRALVAGFFPKQRFLGNHGNLENLEKTEVLDIYFIFENEWAKIRIWNSFKTEEVWERQIRFSGEEDFRKHEEKTSHPYRSYYKNQVKYLLYQMLISIPGEFLPDGFEKRIPAWGTMTGVRPTKIAMQELFSGKSEQEVLSELEELYCCSLGKSRLCLDIAKKETDLLKGVDYKGGYSLYIGIPFCPTTCLYCSFPSYPLEKFGHLSERYLEALEQEIRAVSKGCKGWRLTSIYIGGGTPTSLSAEQLEQLLISVKEHFPNADSVEFTVEAGRPDSITEEKLLVLRKHGVSRISINPQTMQQRTLDLIGRKHTVEDTRHAFFLARKLGFSNINMDLIAGLPGESIEDFSDTLAQAEALEPDSITVHSLVIKRASKLREVLEEMAQTQFAGEVRDVKNGQDTGDVCREHGGFFTEEERMESMGQMLLLAENELPQKDYQPYYMYRQKNSAGHFGSDGQENIGFAKEGKECLYNILIMEELQTIVALGAGASTKLYQEEEVMYRGQKIKNGIVSRIENVKSVQDYIERIDEMIQRKTFLDSANGIGRDKKLECS